MIETNESLLGQLRGDKVDEAWKDFFGAYWGAILRYARKLGLNQHQAEEVLQETMVALMRILPEFVYDRNRGRFRNFLLTIVHRKSLAVLRRNARQREVAWTESVDRDAADFLGDDGTADREAQARWYDSILEEAIRRLRDDPRLGEKTFAVFEAYVIKHQPADKVAHRFELKENAVYQIRNRLMRRLKIDVALLMKSSGAE